MTTNEATNETKHNATIRIWSRIGHTPLTGRGGAYCDELAVAEVVVSGVDAGIAKLRELLASTPHAEKGNVYSPTFPNNFRSNWETAR